MIPLLDHAEGFLLPVKAQPGARKNEVRGEQNGMLKVAVTTVAEKGKANKAILKLLAKVLELRPAQLELLHGETSSQKQILVRACERGELQSKISKIISDQQTL
jgi:uncharacterized protein